MRIGFLKSGAMFVLAAFLVAALSAAAFAQSFDLDVSRLPITQIDSAWRFHLGDDPGWAGADFDDSQWKILQPTTDWTSQGYPKDTELAWFRFHLRVPAHTQSLVLELPAIEKSYQLFSDGQLIAEVGKLPPGRAHNVIGAARVFTLPVNSGSSPKEITVALRLWQDPSIAGTRNSSLEGAAYAGAPDALLQHFATDKATDLLSAGGEYTVDLIILIVGAAAGLLFWLTRERFYLWFACHLVIEVGFLVTTLAAAHQAWNFHLFTYLNAGLDVLSGFALALFIVEALHPGELKLTIPPGVLLVLAEVSVILVLRSEISVKWGDFGYCVTETAAHLILAWYLIRGWREGNLYAKLLFFPFAIDAAISAFANSGYVLMDLGIGGVRNFLPSHILLLRQPFEISLAQASSVLSLLGMLAVLVYRFARTSREQQRLSAALKAARDIQNRLVPTKLPVLGGLRAEIAYQAAEEVGGDFCQILPRPDGSIFVAIGDVSGKGLQAAMLGAVAVGALRSLADEVIGPAAALERLNHVLLRTENAGFVTCFCLVLTGNGEIILANAGHLEPYLNGTEIALEPALPLGVIGGVSYAQSSIALPNEARLTLLSDGVVEARSRSGELFGFERTCRVSQLGASEIADQAHRFGQEDDITVITLDWQAAGVVLA